MLLTPRYDGPPVLRVDTPGVDPAALLVGQRRRLVTALASLDEAAWAAPSRCAGWATGDVVAHLVDADGFWALSIGAGRAGEPTRFLAAFDPVATPPLLVAAQGQPVPDDRLARLTATTDAVEAALADLDDDGWSALAEAPPGHVPLRALALHALWDGWVHERDILLPLGLTPEEHPDELAACLLYAAALGPAFAAMAGAERTGRLAVVADDLDHAVEVDHGVTVVARLVPPSAADGDLVLRAPAIALIDALSLRAPLPVAVPADRRWLLGTLDQVFDQAST